MFFSDHFQKLLGKLIQTGMQIFHASRYPEVRGEMFKQVEL